MLPLPGKLLIRINIIKAGNHVIRNSDIEAQNKHEAAIFIQFEVSLLDFL